MQTTTEVEARKRMLLGIAFGLGAALAYGSSQVVARQAVSHDTPALLGSAMGLFWGTLGFFLLSLRNLGGPATNFRRGALFFAGGGILSALGVLGLFLALERAQVVIVAPIANTNPLFTLVLAAIFLRGVESITPRVVAGALLVVSGVIVLTLG